MLSLFLLVRNKNYSTILFQFYFVYKEWRCSAVYLTLALFWVFFIFILPFMHHAQFYMCIMESMYMCVHQAMSNMQGVSLLNPPPNLIISYFEFYMFELLINFFSFLKYQQEIILLTYTNLGKKKNLTVCFFFISRNNNKKKSGFDLLFFQFNGVHLLSFKWLLLMKAQCQSHFCCVFLSGHSRTR